MCELFIPGAINPFRSSLDCRWENVIDIGTEVYVFDFQGNKQNIQVSTDEGKSIQNILMGIETSIKKGIILSIRIDTSQNIDYYIETSDGSRVSYQREQIGLDMDDLNDKMIMELAKLHRPY